MSHDPRQIRWNGWTAHDDALAAREPVWRWLAQGMAMPALLATPPRALSDIAIPPPRIAAPALARLTGLLGVSGVSQRDLERARHAGGRGTASLLRLRGGDLSGAPDAILYPRTEQDVLAALRLCAELDIAIIPFGGGTGLDALPLRGAHAGLVALSLSGMTHITGMDFLSGLMTVEAGITGAELERQLAARGLALDGGPSASELSTLGGWIARHDAAPWLAGVRLATPQGLLAAWHRNAPDLTRIVSGSQGMLGVITSATLRVRARPAQEIRHGYLFPDFASGIAALREAAREGVPHSLLHLCDDSATRFAHRLRRLEDGWNLRDGLFDIYRAARRFDGDAAALTMGFCGDARTIKASQQKFGAIARKLGALALGRDTHWPQQRYAAPHLRDALLDRGAALDSATAFVRWAKLPGLYVTLRAALKQVMHSHAPRTGARGMVLCHLGPAHADGAEITVTWIFPRKLDDDITQALAIRRVALETIAAQDGQLQDADGLGQAVLRGIKQALDPGDILNPGMRAP